MPRIDLDALPRDPGWRLEPVLLSTFCRAAAVVLQRFHTPPHPVTIMNGDALHSATLMWSTPDSRALATHANSLDATEYGAYALAFAALRRLGPYIVLRRADHSSGADFVLARRTERGDHQILLLEVSGLASGSPSAVERRLRQKLAQVTAQGHELPALAVVVRFHHPTIRIAHAASAIPR